MSNRMKVVEILLSETVQDHQNVFLTHGYGFFQECRRKIGSGHTDWAYLRLGGSPDAEITRSVVKTDIEKAEEYLAGHDLAAAAVSLRKATEEVANEYHDRDTAADGPPEFVGLANMLRAARNRLKANLPTPLYEQVLRGVPDAHRALIVAEDDSDLDGVDELTPAERGRLGTQRRRLRRLLSADHVDQLRAIDLVDQVLADLERVLNPAAHTGRAPLYRQEVEEALSRIRQLETQLSNATST